MNKKELADILSQNSLEVINKDRGPYSADDITDSMLDLYKNGLRNLKLKYPDFDETVDDYDGLDTMAYLKLLDKVGSDGGLKVLDIDTITEAVLNIYDNNDGRMVSIIKKYNAGCHEWTIQEMVSSMNPVDALSMYGELESIDDEDDTASPFGGDMHDNIDGVPMPPAEFAAEDADTDTIPTDQNSIAVDISGYSDIDSFLDDNEFYDYEFDVYEVNNPKLYENILVFKGDSIPPGVYEILENVNYQFNPIGIQAIGNQPMYEFEVPMADLNTVYGAKLANKLGGVYLGITENNKHLIALRKRPKVGNFSEYLRPDYAGADMIVESFGDTFYFMDFGVEVKTSIKKPLIQYLSTRFAHTIISELEDQLDWLSITIDREARTIIPDFDQMEYGVLSAAQSNNIETAIAGWLIDNYYRLEGLIYN